MNLRLSILSLATLTIAVTACSTTPDQTVAQAKEPEHDCVHVTGSSICRRPNSGAISPTNSVSGESLRSGTGTVTGAQPGHIND